MIPKFKEVLLNDELEPEKLRDALKTLNENVHHQVSLIQDWQRFGDLTPGNAIRKRPIRWLTKKFFPLHQLYWSTKMQRFVNKPHFFKDRSQLVVSEDVCSTSYSKTLRNSSRTTISEWEKQPLGHSWDYPLMKMAVRRWSRVASLSSWSSLSSPTQNLKL